MDDQEQRLLLKSQRGDSIAFEQLIDPHIGKVYAICLRILEHPEDAYDTAQDAWVKIFKAINTFKGESTFATWIYRIATNTALDVFRKRKKQQVIAIDATIETEDGQIARELSDHAPMPSDVLERQERIEKLNEAINSLSEQHQKVILYKDIDGFSYEEIAQMLDCSLGTVKSRLNRARQILKEKLLKDGNFFT
ncbi:MAG: sigma-70 family RNA polymerase sigma factor [Hyphomonadaceae bacterium]|nr:sigma-70 family RNA polymerase sigma factor [Clostridia bacterium]